MQNLIEDNNMETNKIKKDKIKKDNLSANTMLLTALEEAGHNVDPNFLIQEAERLKEEEVKKP